MKALKTFSSGGTLKVKQGETFTTSDNKAQEYMRLQLAEPMNGETPKEIKKQVEPIRSDLKTYSEAELKDKTIPDLKKIAKELGVNGYSGMNKTDLIKAILQVQEQ